MTIMTTSPDRQPGTVTPRRRGRAALTTVLIAIATLIGLSAGTADAAPRTGAPTSSCRPGNVVATTTPAPSSAGHRHYAVVLSAAPGTDPCVLAGSPTGLAFSLNGSPRATAPVRAYGDQTHPVVFGPGEPVTFDIQVADSSGPAAANETTFTLRAPGGDIPGTITADGPVGVDAGIAVGPVTAR
jgi:hypothetical protein